MDGVDGVNRFLLISRFKPGGVEGMEWMEWVEWLFSFYS